MTSPSHSRLTTVSSTPPAGPPDALGLARLPQAGAAQLRLPALLRTGQVTAIRCHHLPAAALLLLLCGAALQGSKAVRRVSWLGRVAPLDAS